MPKGRSMLYAIYSACERFRILPPDFQGHSWDELDSWNQTLLLAYDQVRSIEESER